MCGLVGFLAKGGGVFRSDEASTILKRMADTIVLRGPDDFGLWFDAPGIGLAHRRLSILDLSPAGHQPMLCPGNRYAIAFNGEIYH
jgi:asparagine synthase (glutamine-hydrolysing)